MKNKVNIMIIMLLSIIIFTSMPTLTVKAADPIVIVIDPGHGGSNLGAQWNGFTEKDMTLVVAKAMKEELEKYQGVKVYLTRENDVDLSLTDRVNYAVALHADSLVCLHFNMSAEHLFYGAEVWIPAFGTTYSDSYSLANDFLNQFSDHGIFRRGIKTKISKKGYDYYGILRNATANNLKTVLVEHCHLDQSFDESFYNSQEQMKNLGVMDATAVAQNYGLKSSVLNVDYSAHESRKVSVPTAPVCQDMTPADNCELRIVSYDAASGSLTFEVKAKDPQSGILYYAYSVDNGVSYTPLQLWGSGESVTVVTNVKAGTTPVVVSKVWNGYDGSLESNRIQLETVWQ